jgi:glucose/arabinose dehydrogenase
LYSSQFLGNNVARLGAGDPVAAFDVNAPTGLAASTTDLYVASYADGTILQLSADGTLLDAPIVIVEGLAQPEGLAVLPDGDLVVVETGTGDVTRVEVATGETTVLAEGISPASGGLDVYPVWTPNSVAVAPSGNIFVTSPADGNVYRILAS